MTDRVTITIPRRREFSSIAHLVVGGLGARLDLTLEDLEDLQVALASVLEEDGQGPVTVAVSIDGDALSASVGPLEGEALREQLEREPAGEVGLRRILEAVCERVELVERDDGAWLELTKTVERSARP